MGVTAVASTASTAVDRDRTCADAGTVCITRFQYAYSVLTDVLRVNNMRERRLHHYCCRYPLFTFLLLRN